MASDERHEILHQRSIRTSAAHSPTIAHVPGPSAIGRGVVAWISATTMPFAMPLGNTIHDVCGHVVAKLHMIPINIHEVTSGCYDKYTQVYVTISASNYYAICNADVS